MEKITSVLVLGAGVMGKGIAQHTASHGLNATVYSRTKATLAKCRTQISESLADLEARGRISRSEGDLTLSRLTYTTDMEPAARRCGLVIETVSENLDLKQRLFKRLDAICPAETILASNTSSFDIDALADAAERRPERVLGMHWFHPPHITPGIEIIASAKTAPEMVDALCGLCRDMGKTPTRCANTPGFVANRIQMAMAAEALAITAQGLAAPEEVDAIVRSTFGFRLGAFGPFEIMDMAGLDTYLAIMEYMREKLGWDNPEAEKLLASRVKEGRLGLKSGAGFYDYDNEAEKRLLSWRDAFLARRLDVFNAENNERDT